MEHDKNEQKDNNQNVSIKYKIYKKYTNKKKQFQRYF
jgi:hypothetical protein